MFGGWLRLRMQLLTGQEDFTGNTLNSTELEYVVPKNQSSGVISVLPIFRKKGKIYVGLEHRHFPAVQMEEGFSDFITVPAWRVPKNIHSLDDAKNFAKNRFSLNFEVHGAEITELGGMYHPSKGLSPEIVYPMLLEVTHIGKSAIYWVSLDDLITHRYLIKDAHLMISVMRAAHALKRF